MSEPVNIWDAEQALPANVKYVRSDHFQVEYEVVVAGVLVGTVRRQEESTRQAGNYTFWRWRTTCGHLSDKSPGRGVYSKRIHAAAVLIAEAKAHTCEETA